jgi:hypothetical protein
MPRCAGGHGRGGPRGVQPPPPPGAYEHPEGVRRGDVAKALKLEPSVAGVYLAHAVDTGRLQRAERGLYTPVTSVTSLRPPSADVTHNARNTPPEEQ